VGLVRVVLQVVNVSECGPTQRGRGRPPAHTPPHPDQTATCGMCGGGACHPTPIDFVNAGTPHRRRRDRPPRRPPLHPSSATSESDWARAAPTRRLVAKNRAPTRAPKRGRRKDERHVQLGAPGGWPPPGAPPRGEGVHVADGRRRRADDGGGGRWRRPCCRPRRRRPRHRR